MQSTSGSMTNNRDHDHSFTFISQLLAQIHGTPHSHLWLLYFIFITYFIMLSMSLTLSFQTKIFPQFQTCSPYLIGLSSTIMPPVVLSYLKLFSAIIFSCVARSTFLSYIAGNIRFRSRIHQLYCFFLLWIYSLNAFLVIVVNPSLLNPGPQYLKVAYQNVQGLIPFSHLSSSNPLLAF